MTEEEQRKIADDTNKGIDALGKLNPNPFVDLDPRGVAMALTATAAAVVLVTGGTEQDFQNLVDAAWERAVRDGQRLGYLPPT